MRSFPGLHTGRLSLQANKQGPLQSDLRHALTEIGFQLPALLGPDFISFDISLPLRKREGRMTSHATRNLPNIKYILSKHENQQERNEPQCVTAGYLSTHFKPIRDHSRSPQVSPTLANLGLFDICPSHHPPTDGPMGFLDIMFRKQIVLNHVCC